jgi:hypothetical protein
MVVNINFAKKFGWNYYHMDMEMRPTLVKMNRILWVLKDLGKKMIIFGWLVIVIGWGLLVNYWSSY